MEATARGRNLRISWKDATEIGKWIKGKATDKAEKMLEEVIAGEQAVPYKKYNKGLAHRPGNMAAGRYPKKAAKEIKRLLNSAVKNAEYEGLSSDLVIETVKVSPGARYQTPKRQRGREVKATNIELEISERFELEISER